MARGKSKSKAVAEKTVFAALTILKDAGGELRGSEVIDKIRETVQFTEWEKERYEKTGYIRWESHKHIELIDFNHLTDLWQQYYSKMSDEEKKHAYVFPKT